MVGFPFDSRLSYDAETGDPVYDRAVSSEPLRDLIKQLFTTGVMPNPSTCYQVSASTGMTINVAAGFAVVDGGLCEEENSTTLSVSASDNTYPRIDTVVLQWNENIDVRQASLYVKEGTASANPTRPTLTRTSSVYEIGLADILIPSRSTAVTNANITDTRMESDRCGIVSSVSQWDTTTIYQQIQSELAEFKSDEETDFADWFERMKDQLSEDAAGHLQNEIDGLQSEIDDVHDISDIASELSVDYSKSVSHIGMIIQSTTLDTEAKVKAIYGGEEWTQIQGRMLLGANSSHAVNSTGGSETNSHTHTIASHTHTINSHYHGLSSGHANMIFGAYLSQFDIRAIKKSVASWSTGHRVTINGDVNVPSAESSTDAVSLGGTTDGSGTLTSNGSGQLSTSDATNTNNMPPYKAVYIWERTA